ncbi:acyl-CoA dehydrogenase family protein [Nocardia sp. NPDC057440]|uniref:acyl-CoA dehydrogenase family protein n=1 Tax=Nocardia sp. NPDC057440 TaxID=3346134 RepID=UPI00366EE009
MDNLPGRVVPVNTIAIGAVAGMETASEHTLRYTKEREAFGRNIFGVQNSKFTLAEVATEAKWPASSPTTPSPNTFGQLDIPTVAMAKWWTTDRAMSVAHECLQLHGGYGYMQEYPISRMWVDNRVRMICAGTNEIMKEIIARAL